MTQRKAAALLCALMVITAACSKRAAQPEVVVEIPAGSMEFPAGNGYQGRCSFAHGRQCLRGRGAA